MDSLISEIQADIDWRTSEISSLKSIPLRYDISEPHKKILTLYSIPCFYSIWEGYLKNTFEELTKYINSKNIDFNEANINLIAHTIDNKFNLRNERKDFEKKIKLVSSIKDMFSIPFKINQGIPTESNCNFKNTNKILNRFKIKNIDSRYEDDLNKLLLFRNKISHGENSIVVSQSHADDFSLLIINLMYEVLLLIEEYIEKKLYLKY